jgi:hypothetical protein
VHARRRRRLALTGAHRVDSESIDYWQTILLFGSLLTGGQVVCGGRLAWGYVDQPPLIPLLVPRRQCEGFVRMGGSNGPRGQLTAQNAPAGLAKVRKDGEIQGRA